MPEFTFRHHVLDGAAERWRTGGGSKRLLQMLRRAQFCSPRARPKIAPRPPRTAAAGDPANVASFQRLLRFTTAMFVVPLATMTVAFMVLEPLVAKPADRMVYAGVAAIVAVQAVIVAFLVSAWNEDDVPMPAKPAPPPPKKRKFRWLLCFAPSEPGLGAISSTLKAD